MYDYNCSSSPNCFDGNSSVVAPTQQRSSSPNCFGGASPLQSSPPAGTTSPLDTPKRPFGAEIPRWKLIIAYRAVHPAIQPLDGLKFSPFYRVKCLRYETKIRKNGLKSKLSRAFSRDERILKLYFPFTAEYRAHRPFWGATRDLPRVGGGSGGGRRPPPEKRKCFT